jgi:uncharacterized membrane protein
LQIGLIALQAGGMFSCLGDVGLVLGLQVFESIFEALCLVLVLVASVA